MIGACDWFLKICFMSSVFRSWSIVCGCTCSSCHIVPVDIYICSIRRCGALLTWPDRQGVTSVLPVGGWTSVVTGVFRWVRVAAVGLRAAACLGVVGATDGCTAEAVGACCSCTVLRLMEWWQVVQPLQPGGACQAWQHLGDVHECGLMLICIQLHQWLWRCMSHDQLHVQ